MNKKEEIQKQIVEDKNEIDRIITKAKMFSPDEITKLDHLYAHMEQLKFQLRSVGDDEDAE